MPLAPAQRSCRGSCSKGYMPLWEESLRSMSLPCNAPHPTQIGCIARLKPCLAQGRLCCHLQACHPVPRELQQELDSLRFTSQQLADAAACGATHKWPHPDCRRCSRSCSRSWTASSWPASGQPKTCGNACAGCAPGTQVIAVSSVGRRGSFRWVLGDVEGSPMRDVASGGRKPRG